MEFKIEQQCPGTKILGGYEVKQRRVILNELIRTAEDFGCEEIIIPTIQPVELYPGRINAMYNFMDWQERLVCLKPDVTTSIQAIATAHWNFTKEIKLWYFEKCFRDKAGEDREFWQFGVYIVNPRQEYKQELTALAIQMVRLKTIHYVLEPSITLFEIHCSKFGTESLLCRSHRHLRNGLIGGSGFAIEFDRLMLT